MKYFISNIVQYINPKVSLRIMSFQILVYFWSTVRVHFPIKESKLVAAIGDSVTLVCSAEGYPLDIEWTKNEPGSTAVIKRKTFLSILEFNILTSESFFSLLRRKEILGRKRSRTSSKGQIMSISKHFGTIKVTMYI